MLLLAVNLNRISVVCQTQNNCVTMLLLFFCILSFKKYVFKLKTEFWFILIIMLKHKNDEQ